MKSTSIVTAFFIVLFTSICFAQPQPDGKGRKPPTSEERLKMVNEKICPTLLSSCAHPNMMLTIND